VILDMLAPWECVEVVHKALRPGGVVCIYVATTTQMSRTVEAMREYGGWTEPESTETLLRRGMEGSQCAPTIGWLVTRA
jgi:tRNA (adenine57-N1/adenine58-N1)-methyltransferase